MKNFKFSLFSLAILFFAMGCQEDNEVVPSSNYNADDALLNKSLVYQNLEVNGNEVSVAKLGEGFLVDGDIYVSDEQALEEYVHNMVNEGPETESNLGAMAWRNRTVYYVFASNFAYRSAIQQAMNIISQQTGARFVQGTGSGSYIYIFTRGNNVNFSAIGQQGGQQLLSLGRNSVGVAIHEIGHAMGLLHEHSRPDRDNFISVSPYVANDPNFSRQGYSYGQFDFSSMMIYPSRYYWFGYDMVNRSTGQPFNSNVETSYNRFSPGDLNGLRAVGW